MLGSTNSHHYAFIVNIPLPNNKNTANSILGILEAYHLDGLKHPPIAMVFVLTKK